MSAEKKRSKGAPLLICWKKFPDEPYTTLTVIEGLVRVKTAIAESMANLRSAAAAIRTSEDCDGTEAGCDGWAE